MTNVDAKRVALFDVQAVAADAIVMRIQSGDEDSYYVFRPGDFNSVIERMLVASVQPVVTASHERPPPYTGRRAETVVTFPIECFAVSYVPDQGNVGINVTIASGLKLTFVLPPREAVAVAQQIQTAAAQLQGPKSSAKH